MNPNPVHLTRDALDLCAGIGGWSLALQERGIADWAVENNKHARNALRANGIRLHHIDDMTQIVEKRGHADAVDGVVASTPCQPFSQANSSGRGIDDPRGHLTLEFGRIVAELLPPFACLENVGRGTEPVFRYLVEQFQALGYAADEMLINAADYGLPQARKRRLLVARRDGHQVHWPRRTHVDARKPVGRDLIEGGALLPWVTMAEALPERTDLPEWAHKSPATTIVGSFEPKMVAPPTYRKAGDGPRQSQPDAVRTSLEERLLLQGFPRDWKTAGPKTAQGLQVGNAIPPVLARIALHAALS